MRRRRRRRRRVRRWRNPKGRRWGSCSLLHSTTARTHPLSPVRGLSGSALWVSERESEGEGMGGLRGRDIGVYDGKGGRRTCRE